MTSLTQIAITARKAIRYTIFAIIFLIVGKFLLDAGIAVYLQIFPPAPPPPTVKFGKLTKINFPNNGITAKLNFGLETPTGSLPTNIPTQAKVYFMPKPASNLLALDTAKEKAKALGFSGEPVQESDVLYKFPNSNYPSSLEMNIVTGTFSISYDLAADRSPISTKPPDAQVAASEFKSVLSSANILPDDMSGPTTHEFFKLSSGQLQSAISLSESDVVKVNLFRKDYDKLPAMTANPNVSNVWAIISGSNAQGQQIIASEYHYYPVDETQYSTYPIITPQEAFSQLQAGQAYIATLGQYKDGDSVKIRRVYLAYFDPSNLGDFYQPIYVFSSDDNNPFIAYFPAVSPTYYGQ